MERRADLEETFLLSTQEDASGDSISWHTDVYVPSIRSGIKTMTGANFRGRSQFGEGFYLTRLKIAAQYFADIAAQNTGGKPEILRFKIPVVLNK